MLVFDIDTPKEKDKGLRLLDPEKYTTVADVVLAINKLDAFEDRLRARHKHLVKTLTMIKCDSVVARDPGCGREFPVGELTYIQTQFYVKPYSCTGGDYWKNGEGRFKCPACGRINRLIFEREPISSLKNFFKETVIERKDDGY